MRCSVGKEPSSQENIANVSVNEAYRHRHIGKVSHSHTLTPDLECDTADGQVAAVLQHVEVLCHKGGAVHQAVGSLSMVPSLRVFPCHVL